MDTTQSHRTEPPRRLPRDLQREIERQAKEEIDELDRIAQGEDLTDKD